MPVFSDLLLVSLAGVGRTQQEGWIAEFVHVSTDAVHLLAAGRGSAVYSCSFIYFYPAIHDLGPIETLKEFCRDSR